VDDFPVSNIGRWTERGEFQDLPSLHTETDKKVTDAATDSPAQRNVNVILSVVAIESSRSGSSFRNRG
jgi:hypothetical protein